MLKTYVEQSGDQVGRAFPTQAMCKEEDQIKYSALPMACARARQGPAPCDSPKPQHNKPQSKSNLSLNAQRKPWRCLFFAPNL
jgi:hypothetical protein